MRGEERPRRATIVDVARLSGVSKSTVANVINQSAPLSKHTRARVLAAMDELGYRPNALARDLRRRRTATVGVLVGDLSNPFFGELTKLLEQRLARASYATMICDTDGDRSTEREKLALLLEQRVSGILLLHFTGDRKRIHEVQAAGAEIVGVSVFDRGFDCVASDDAHGTRLAVEHLTALGHERIAYVPSGDTERSTNAARRRGWRRALQRAGLSPGPVVAHASLESALHGPERPTAYVVGNDLTALHVVDRLEASGIAVPRHASVVGFDDIRLAGLDRLSLTTVRQPVAQLAERGVARMLERFEASDRPPVHERLAPRLIERGTTARPAVDTLR